VQATAIVDVRDAWIAALRSKNFSKKTIQTYGAGLTNLLRFLGRRKIEDFREITAAVLKDWQAYLIDSCVSPVSIDVYLRAVRGLCRWLTDTNQVFLNPARDLPAPKLEKKLGPIVSEKDMLRLLDGMTGTDLLSMRDRAILEVAYGTGARVEEMARLNVESLNLGRRLVHIHGKGERDRILPLTRAACCALKVYLDKGRLWMVGKKSPERALFISLTSKRRLDPVSISGVIKCRGKAGGLAITPHVIRRSVITHMVCRGAPLAQIKAILGHSSYRHMGRYAQLQTAAMLDLIRQRKGKR
jgi:site-specific recombinase XerD